MPLTLVTPGCDYLPGYIAALETGWSPNTGRDVSGEHLAAIAADAGAFLADLNRTEGGGIIKLPDREVERLPGHILWMWDGAFCGSINFRYVPGTEDLPSHVSGHIGYAVVPWKRGRGYATAALRQILPVAAAAGFPRVLITCDDDNTASRRVIEANGGCFTGKHPHAEREGRTKLLFWVPTSPGELN